MRLFAAVGTLVLILSSAIALVAATPQTAPPREFLSMVAKYPGGPTLFAWAVVLGVTVLLCVSAESRDYLLRSREGLEPG